jgi:CHAT domain-containing protein
MARAQALQEEFEKWALRQRQALDGQPPPAVTRSLAAEYRRLEVRRDALEGEVRSRSPRYAALARPHPLTLAQVQDLVLDDATVLLEYALGEERSYLWAVSRGRYTVHDLPSRPAIARAAQQLTERLTARLSLSGTLQERRRAAEASDARYWEAAGELSRTLLGPAGTALAGKRIVVVPDGVLQYVPFAALPDPGRPGEHVPLLAGHEVVMLPSATALAVLRRETAGRLPPPGAVAVIADPVFERDDPRLRAVLRPAQAQASGRPATGGSGPAPPSAADRTGPLRLTRLGATRMEADAIVAFAGASASLRRIGFDASRSAAMSPDLAGYRVVHFATHGILDNANPGMSGIMLSLFDARGRAVDGFLRLHDIYRLALPAEVVVLSACSTAMGRPVDGEGLVGVVRGFMYAGAKRVVASLWKVDDEATGELMRRFYEQMFAKGLPPAAALREAQLGLWRQPRWQAPFYWAAFSVQGEWRP